MRVIWAAPLGIILTVCVVQGQQTARNPVIVELFTSEGCSDCPAADRLLEQLDRTQPVPGTEIIALGEHVDYWDSLGWKDPFSAHVFSQRQESYARRLGLNGVYTPQMVVDGTTEFVGSDGQRALSVIAAQTKARKAGIRIVREPGVTVRVEVEPQSGRPGDVFLAVIEKDGASQVLRGENRGRSLHHIAIVRRIESLGRFNGRTPFTKEWAVKEAGETGFRLVAFLQDSDFGRIRGAALLGSQ